MSRRRRITGVAAGALGLAATGAALGVARQSRQIGRRPLAPAALGSLRSAPVTIVADDGVSLHVEVDELDPAPAPTGRRSRRQGDDAGLPAPLTVVFIHGYALNLDCWHFQRAAYRGLVRTVFYDQRSHGRSGRSDAKHATIEQLASDLVSVLEHTAPDGPVVLIGHSMGGMTIVALAEKHPELFGDRIVGVGLISTTAGGLDPTRILLPMIPAKLSAGPAQRAVRTLARGHRAVDGLRRVGQAIATVGTDLFAFGGEVPAEYVTFVDDMLSATPFQVVAEFFPAFGALDKFAALDALNRVPTTVICGTADKLTSIGHSRKLHATIADSTLVECAGAGHMVIIECHHQVNAALDQLLSAAVGSEAAR
jgi:pimeloyl-ACP methyl ester carboxylesterase